MILLVLRIFLNRGLLSDNTGGRLNMGRNKYVGKWTETGAKKIDVQFTRENLDFLPIFL